MHHDRHYVEGNPPLLSVDGFTFDLQRFAFTGGDGSADNPYQIASVDDLQTLATDVNGGTDYSGTYFKLTADIELNGVNFTAIGTESKQFKGTFDGNNSAGYKISNLTISGTNDNVGLFGYVGEGGTIQNVTLTNATVSGNKSVGGLVGKNYGTVSDNTVSSKVTGTGDDNGGVVGSNYGTVTGNTVVSEVSGNYKGGIVGYNYNGGKVTDNYYYSNVGAIDSEDDENNTRLYKSLELPEGVTAEYTGSDDYTLTIDGTTYYKSGAPFKLTVTNFPDGKYLKGATVDDDGNFIYTLSDTAVEWADIPTIEGLTFNSSINGFTIATAADLQALATYVNAGNDCADLTFKLTANINLTGVSFTPIGKYENWNKIPFSGTFDGAGYTISNLTISDGGDYVGLFGYVGKGGTIKNVTLTGVNVEGYRYVGALVGENEGGTVTNCIVSGEVTSTGDYVGGVVAYNYGTVSGNTAFITFSGGDIVGGLVGRNNSGGTVTDNKFYSNKDAIGSDSGTVENNTRLYLFTELEGVNSEYTVSGNLKVTFDGKNYYASGATFTLTVTKYTDGKYLKGATFIGNDTFTYTISSTAVEWADIPKIGNLEFDRSINGFNISTAEQLQALATFVNGGGDTTDLTFKLAADIDLKEVSNWTPIGNSSSKAFKGTFDGDGHTISNLTINISSNNVGLFGYVSGGTVQKLTLDTVRISGSSEVGGLVGTNKGGTVTNCTVTGNTVTGNDDVGGLVGWNDGGTVTDSIVDNVSLFTKDNTHANVGGLVGDNNKGTVSGNTVSNGTITDTNTSGREGGLVGLNYKGTVSDNTVDVKITVGADAWVGGVAGRNNDGTVTGNVAVSEITAGNNANVGSVVGYEEYNSSTIKNNFFHSTANDVVGKFYYSGTNENITDNNPLYVVTLPGGVEITGDTCATVNGKTYAAGNITVAAKTGYVYSGNTSVEITADTDLSKLGNTTLDTSDNKYYVFKDGDTYTLATADNVATAGYPDLEQVYALTFQGVEVTGENVFNVDGTTYAIGEVTIAVKTGYIYSGSTTVNVTEDTSINATDVWGVEVSDGSTANPYLISSVAGLQYLAEYVNAGNTCEGLTFKLNADIDLSTVDNFTPIGNSSNQFKGTFDGNNSAGYTINKLTISGSDNNVGMFGSVGEGGTIQNVTLTDVNITGNNNVGGLIGDNKGEVTNCTVSGKVSGNNYVGGLVGSNDGTVKDNIFYSNIDAVGTNTGTVENNTRYYKLTLPEDVTASGGNSFTFDGTTYATGTVTLLSTKTGYALNKTSIDVTEDTDLSTTLTATDVWGVEGGANGSADNPYLISSVEGLQLLADYVNAGNTCAGLNFKLADDIDLSSVENFTTIGNYTDENNYNPFSGTFDGDNHTISKLKINSTLHYNGLFSYVGEGGTVKNVTLTDVDINGNGRLGGLVGENYGTVTNCIVSGDSTITGKGPYVGGLVGYNGGTVTGSKVVATVTANTTNSNPYVGGVVGQNVKSGTVGTSENPNYYHSNKGAVNGADDDNNVPIYELTLPDGVTASGALLTDGNKAYVTAGTVTLSGDLKDGYVFSRDTINVEQDTTVIPIPNPANHYVLANDTKTLATADNVGDYPDLIPVYALTLQGVTVSGDSVVIIDGTTYATGNITVAAKTGYTISDTSLNVTGDTTVTATLADGHYVFKEGNTYTLATAENIAANDYPELVHVYALTLPEGVSVNSGIYTVDNGKYYATGTVTLTTTGYTSTVTVDADHTEFTDIIKFNKAGTGVEVDGTKGDLSGNNGVYSISASQQNSTIIGNTKNNTVILTGGGENILTGGGGNDTYKFSTGGGIVTDFGIGATKSGNGKALSAPGGTDVVKVMGKVMGVYFDRATSNKKSATFTAVVTYDSNDVAGDDTQIIVLKDIAKKPTKYGSNPVYRTNDVAAATLKIWDTSGSKQAVLSASKLKKLFKDDDALASDLSETLQTQLVKLDSIGDLNLPAVDQLKQTAQATFNGDDNG